MYHITHTVYGQLTTPKKSIGQVLNWFYQNDVPKPNREKMYKVFETENEFSFCDKTIIISKI